MKRNSGCVMIADGINAVLRKDQGDGPSHRLTGRERETDMAAFFVEFTVEVIRFIILIGVCVAAVFCGKKLRDRKDAKTASRQESGK